MQFSEVYTVLEVTSSAHGQISFLLFLASNRCCGDILLRDSLRPQVQVAVDTVGAWKTRLLEACPRSARDQGMMRSNSIFIMKPNIEIIGTLEK